MKLVVVSPSSSIALPNFCGHRIPSREEEENLGIYFYYLPCPDITIHIRRRIIQIPIERACIQTIIRITTDNRDSHCVLVLPFVASGRNDYQKFQILFYLVV